MMTASIVNRDLGYVTFKAIDGSRQWTATLKVRTDGWAIFNERWQPVSEFGALGIRIIRACEKAFDAVENAA